MQIKKVLISFMLLMVYTISFAHELIPHCHHALGLSEEPHVQLMQHEHHNEGKQHHDGNDQSHVSHHQDHSQKCLSVTDDPFCLLSCLLSEIEHPPSDVDQHFILPEADAIFLNDRLEIQLSSVLTILFDFYEDNTKVAPQPEVKDFYSPPLLAHSQNRGPPSISC